MKLQVNDRVRVIVGKDKGREAVVSQVLPKRNMVVLEGINVVVRHRKPQYGQAGERVSVQKPIAVSKLAIINRSGDIDRVGYQVLKDGTKVRIFKKSGDQITQEKPAEKKPAKKTVTKPTKKAKK